MARSIANRLERLEAAAGNMPSARGGDAELHAAVAAAYDGLPGAGALLHTAMMLVHGAEGAARFEAQCRYIYCDPCDGGHGDEPA